ncbi:uncharacterized protein LOC143038394 isoform X2 [Oratosquilla oratoria]|uniref:uncharacterized protein LOC143038394 isoform X2 n=1 Tax=Oratosquilla oratoria TaxID=337810 RepID=UPI003F776785
MLQGDCRTRYKNLIDKRGRKKSRQKTWPTTRHLTHLRREITGELWSSMWQWQHPPGASHWQPPPGASHWQGQSSDRYNSQHWSHLYPGDTSWRVPPPPQLDVSAHPPTQMYLPNEEVHREGGDCNCFKCKEAMRIKQECDTNHMNVAIPKFSISVDSNISVPKCNKKGKPISQVGEASREKLLFNHTLLGIVSDGMDDGYEDNWCPHCNATFPSYDELRTHMLTHTTERPYKCTECDASFTLSGNLRRHHLTHTGERPHKCSQCEATFTQSGHLRTHLLTHSGERPHKCPHCNAAFTLSGNLRRHLLTHTGERPHKCDQCEAAFAASGSLKTHLLAHAGERPHKCDHCDAAFTHSGNLKKHILTHTGGRPHKCTQCDAAFTQSGHLKAHLLTHTGEKPHKCSHCDAAFARSGNLKRHLLTHSAGST